MEGLEEYLRCREEDRKRKYEKKKRLEDWHRAGTGIRPSGIGFKL